MRVTPQRLTAILALVAACALAACAESRSAPGSAGYTGRIDPNMTPNSGFTGAGATGGAGSATGTTPRR